MALSRTDVTLKLQLNPARAVEVGNLAGAYNNGSANNGVGATLTAAAPAALVVDGVNMELGDTVALAAQTNANENGLYKVVAPGNASVPWMLQRAFDMQSNEQLKLGQYFSVYAGTLAGAMYMLVEPLPGLLGVDDLTLAVV